MEIFARRLRELRENKGLVQGDCAKRLGISHVAFGNYERNAAEPKLANLVKICQFFGVSADYMIGIDKCDNKPILTNRINALKTEADQAAATLARLVGQIKEMEKSV